MARAIGQTDAASETQLALARFHLNQLPDPPTKPTASRTYRASLTSTSPNSTSPSATPTAPNTTRSLPTNGHWADGEPYVFRYYLNKSRALLEKLNIPIPNLPPYDPSKREPFPWEPAVHAAIAKLRAQNAHAKPATAE